MVPGPPAFDHELDRSAHRPFIGRERELATLRTALTDARAGRGQVVLLAGEPGIGKTSLCDAFAAYATTCDVTVLWGRCPEWDGAPPYWPWMQILRASLGCVTPEELRGHVEAAGPHLSYVLPDLDQHGPDLPPSRHLPPDQARFQVFDAVTSYLRRFAAAQPLVLILDDLHWADDASLLLLQFLAQQLHAIGVLIIATYRNVEVGRHHPLARTLATLARDMTTQRVVLRGFSQAEVARCMAHLADHSPAPEIVAAVTRETEGNAFFVTELTRLLIVDGLLDDHAYTGMRWRIPESVREVVGQRLSRLSDSCSDVLAIAAVLGRDFGVAVLEHVSQQSSDQLLALLDEALAAGLIVEQDRVGLYRFSHALVQETIVSELSVATRCRLHQRAGTVIEELSAADRTSHLSELAHHFVQAAPLGEAARAVAYSQQAGDQAIVQLAWEAAVRHYQRALEVFDLQLSPNESARCDLLLALGAAHWLSGQVAAGEARYLEAASIARVIGSSDHLARAALGFAGADMVGAALGGSEQAQLLQEALDALPISDSVLRARALAILATCADPQNEREIAATQALAMESLSMARRLGDPHTLLSALAARWWSLGQFDSIDDRFACADEVVHLATALNEPFWTCEGYWWRGLCWIERINMLAANRDLHAPEAILAKYPIPAGRWVVAMVTAMRALMEGRLEDVEQAAEVALAHADTLPGAERRVMHYVLGVRREQQRLPEIVDDLGSIISRDTFLETYWRAYAVLVALDLGQVEDARSGFNDLASDGFSVALSTGSLTELALLADACSTLGDQHHAARLYELLEPYADRVVMRSWQVCFGAAAYYLGRLATVLERWDAAEQHFEVALRHNEALAARPFIAYTQWAYADLLLARRTPGDHERARCLIDRASITATDLGLRRLASCLATTRQRLVDADARTEAHEVSSNRYGLTPREREVLHGIVAGQSDRAIADALFISHRTVTSHVTSILGKLGVSSRTAAAAMAVREELV